LTIGRQAAAGHDTMQVRVILEVLSPTVKHGEETNLSSEVLRIGCDGCQGFGRCTKEDAVDHPFVLIGDRGDLCRHGEHDMIIGANRNYDAGFESGLRFSLRVARQGFKADAVAPAGVSHFLISGKAASVAFSPASIISRPLLNPSQATLAT